MISKEHKNKSLQMKLKFQLYKIQQTAINHYTDSTITTMRQQREVKQNIHINNGMKQQMISINMLNNIEAYRGSCKQEKEQIVNFAEIIVKKRILNLIRFQRIQNMEVYALNDAMNGTISDIQYIIDLYTSVQSHSRRTAPLFPSACMRGQFIVLALLGGGCL
ncbi:Hypothetical_protein [Hexamita inflata]|uniref:Hypothetical_protein n=1 Tax=Hexamita inflata TaxID=28002 RepID=A0AA86QT29_9EUKA|nr:Hypothetical protein HINF_LOCUS46658 [Hexamita inflata]